MNDSIENILIRSLLEKSQMFVRGDDIQISKLAGDASTRKYFRVCDSVSSFVCCLDRPTDGESSDFIKVSKFLSEMGVGIPEIFVSYPEKGFILQEDLGDDMLVNYLSKDYDEIAIENWYKKSIDVILRLQNIPKKDVPKFITRRKFDKDKYKFEFGVTTEYFLKKYLNFTIEGKLRESYNGCLDYIIEKIMHNDYTLVHRDYHSRNIMIKNDVLKIIDYQDIMLGSKYYDLVSLLEDSYFPLKDITKHKLIKYFKDATGDKTGDDEMILQYDLNAIQRVYKALGSFTYIYDTREDDRYLKYVGVGFSRLTQLLEKYEELHPLLKIILKAYHGN